MKLAVDPQLGRRIGSLATPVMVAMVSQTLINQVDEAFIGRLPLNIATPGQAAIGTSLILFWAIGGSLAAISVGTQALTARRTGEQEHERAGQVLFNSLLVATLTSIVASIVGWLAAPYLFRMVAKSPEQFALGVPYLQWRLVGVASMVTTTSYKSWFDGLGRTRVFMGAAITMNLINALLNWLLIFGNWGFPALGVAGSGIASMISGYIGLLLMVIWSLRSRYRREYAIYHVKNLSSQQQWEIVRLSAPSACATIFVMSGFMYFKHIVDWLDDAAKHGAIFGAATWNIIVILMLFFTMFMAYGSAVATLVSQSMGAKQMKLAERYGWEAVKIGVYFTLVIGGLIILLPDSILHILTLDEQVIAVARPILRICGLLLPAILAALVLTQALFGAGNTKFVMFAEFGLHFFCLVPLAYLFGVVMGLGVMGVWMSAFTYIVLLCAVMGWKFAEGAWKEIRI
jgi:putative MATE family efflux protein